MEYWASIFAVALVIGLLNYFTHSSVSVGEFLLIWIGVPRLHDIGKSGFFILVVFAIEIASLIATFSLAPQIDRETLGWPLAVANLTIAGLALWLGIIRGDTNPNDFGAPPKRGVSLWTRRPLD
jgi:uncharacterized membrane protein YhaH (DUF805 family)